METLRLNRWHRHWLQTHKHEG